MNQEARISVSDPLPSEAKVTSKESSTKALHKYIFLLITTLGAFLQLKQGAGTTSLFDTHHQIVVILIVALVVYGGSLIGGAYIDQAHLDLGLEKFMSNISLLLGALALILELMILIPALGLAALLFWIFWFVTFVAVYSYPYVKTLFTSLVARVVHAFEKLDEYLKNMVIARFTVKPEEEQSGTP